MNSLLLSMEDEPKHRKNNPNKQAYFSTQFRGQHSTKWDNCIHSANSPHCPRNSLGQDTRVGSRFLLQGIFLTRVSCIAGGLLPVLPPVKWETGLDFPMGRLYNWLLVYSYIFFSLVHCWEIVPFLEFVHFFHVVHFIGKIVLAIQGHLCSHTNSKILCSNSVRNAIGYLIEIALSL